MKIALVSDCYLPRLGGIEVQVHDLAQRLVAQGHEVVAYTVTPAHREQHSGLEIVDGIPVHRFSLGLPHDVALNPMAVSQLRLALSKGGFDVVHAHIGVISVFSFDAVRLALDLGLPTAVTWHSVMAWAGPLLKPLGFVRRWAKGGAALSAVSQVAARPIRDMAGRGHEVVVPDYYEGHVFDEEASGIAHRDAHPEYFEAVRELAEELGQPVAAVVQRGDDQQDRPRQSEAPPCKQQLTGDVSRRDLQQGVAVFYSRKGAAPQHAAQVTCTQEAKKVLLLSIVKGY